MKVTNATILLFPFFLFACNNKNNLENEVRLFAGQTISIEKDSLYNPYYSWAKHPAPYPPCGGRFPSTRPQTVLTCLHVYGFPLVTLLFTIVLNHRVAVLTDNKCLAMSFEHQSLPLIIAFQLGESPHMMHDYFSFLTT